MSEDMVQVSRNHLGLLLFLSHADFGMEGSEAKMAADEVRRILGSPFPAIEPGSFLDRQKQAFLSTMQGPAKVENFCAVCGATEGEFVGPTLCFHCVKERPDARGHTRGPRQGGLK